MRPARLQDGSHPLSGSNWSSRWCRTESQASSVPEGESMCESGEDGVDQISAVRVLFDVFKRKLQRGGWCDGQQEHNRAALLQLKETD